MSTERSHLGFSVIEVLVALVILSLAIAGSSQVIGMASGRIIAEQHQQAIALELEKRSVLGVAGEGESELSGLDSVVVWRVTRTIEHEGRLAGVRSQWIRIHTEVFWDVAGRGHVETLDRVVIEPITASH